MTEPFDINEQLASQGRGPQANLLGSAGRGLEHVMEADADHRSQGARRSFSLLVLAIGLGVASTGGADIRSRHRAGVHV